MLVDGCARHDVGGSDGICLMHAKLLAFAVVLFIAAWRGAVAYAYLESSSRKRSTWTYVPIPFMVIIGMGTIWDRLEVLSLPAARCSQRDCGYLDSN
jgi:hypothetical protein